MYRNNWNCNKIWLCFYHLLYTASELSHTPGIVKTKLCSVSVQKIIRLDHSFGILVSTELYKNTAWNSYWKSAVFESSFRLISEQSYGDMYKPQKIKQFADFGSNQIWSEKFFK
jgi:hypothetical protein